jgi:hypothetical protein
VSAEDALNTHQKKMALRSEVFNKARTAHMKEFQARFTKELQVQRIVGVWRYYVLCGVFGVNVRWVTMRVLALSDCGVLRYRVRDGCSEELPALSEVECTQ